MSSFVGDKMAAGGHQGYAALGGLYTQARPMVPHLYGDLGHQSQQIPVSFFFLKLMLFGWFYCKMFSFDKGFKQTLELEPRQFFYALHCRGFYCLNICVTCYLQAC